MSLIGFEKEKRAFQPHLTLCRIKRVRKLDMHPVEAKRFFVEEMVLVESVLRREGARYTTLEKFRLGS